MIRIFLLGLFFSFSVHAGSSSVSQFMKKVGSKMEIDWSAVKKSMSWSGSMGVKGYGNWCGKGGSGPTIDALDEVCRAHDMCFSRNPSLEIKKSFGTFGACSCDQALLQDLRTVLPRLKKQYAGAKNKLLHAKAYRHWLFVKKFFGQQICLKHARVCKTVLVKKKKEKCTQLLGKKKCVTVVYPSKKTVCKQKIKWGRGGR